LGNNNETPQGLRRQLHTYWSKTSPPNPQIKERERIVNSFRAHKAKGRKHAVSRVAGFLLFNGA